MTDARPDARPDAGPGARPLRPEPALGAVAQLGVLLLLGAVTGLGPAGWLTGLAFTAATWAVLSRALRGSRPRPTPFGPADAVTLARTTLAGGVTALVADLFAGRAPVTALAVLTAVALALDAVDGQVARRTGTASPFGARFDMEADAFLIMVLSVQVSLSMGAWVLAIGAMRYVFVAAARVLPWLNGPLPPSMARKTVAAVQGVVLLVAGTGALPRVPAYAAVAAALALLVWSFGRDIRWLWRVRVDVRVPVPAAAAGAPVRQTVRPGA
ncbi:CDP-alcohol phosphatidyltransferase family protein [Streptomyces ficellus]|uniref:CDP-alcohol phosphatidyltransferase family protein n=1 Tax=Streptomyces ficellus TaxID=1977088 RepID=A0A6I6F7W0_9ACTN|nr:CDP-alcohol phosphatidyltransferase family protein [Streptomyces ficellus]QGV77137.1 CDP-alcohol phosphatidyltransferase family protein [Streptomyces ficellus]